MLAVKDGNVLTVSVSSQAEDSSAIPYLIQVFTLSKERMSCNNKWSSLAARAHFIIINTHLATKSAFFHLTGLPLELSRI